MVRRTSRLAELPADEKNRVSHRGQALPAYFGRLVDYALAADWGRRSVARHDWASLGVDALLISGPQAGVAAAMKSACQAESRRRHTRS